MVVCDHSKNGAFRYATKRLCFDWSQSNLIRMGGWVGRWVGGSVGRRVGGSVGRRVGGSVGRWLGRWVGGSVGRWVGE